MAGNKDDDLGDVYELLGVDEDAGDKEVQAAFRKGSLKCHPDRNPDDPDAPEKFDRLTRAKELLLDPTRRADYDHKRKAKRELEERFSQEDAKRRKLREDLESREGAAALASARANQAAAQAEARKKYTQMDYLARIRAKEAERAGKAAEVAVAASKSREEAEDARVRIKWREPGEKDIRTEAVKKALADFELRSIMFDGDREAVCCLGSREDAVRAVLAFREKRQQMAFRVLLEKSKRSPTKPVPAETRNSKEDPGSSRDPPVHRPSSQQQRRGLSPTKLKANVPVGGFDDWEAQMLNNLAGLARAQKGTKS